MKLTLNYIVSKKEDNRAIKDRRFKVNMVIASYIGEDMQEYRKRFESKETPIVPKEGTHEMLNKLSKQY